jgi:xanthine dehydrogenase small subunit
MRDHLLLYVNGCPVRVHGDDAFLTLAEFLRRRQRLTGTKVVCAEGDCGSCSVLVGRGDDPRRTRYTTVTSCIQLMFQLDGAHVVTVEGLNAEGARCGSATLQQCMVTCHGAQCGFCTPGFVVSLHDLMHAGQPIDAHAIRRGLVGNLCRCTGYDSIVRAALAADRAAIPTIDALYPPADIAANLSQAVSEEVLIQSPSGRTFYKPTSIDQATTFRAAHADCAIIAGATDLGVTHNKGTRPITVAMTTTALADLRDIRATEDSLYIGATATLADLERAAADHFPEFARFLAWFGSPPIKNAATLAGNLVTASPIGDTLPMLIALEAQIDLAGPNGRRRRLAMADFYTGYRRTALAPDELVIGVEIPLPRPGEIFKLYKVSRRKDLDISAVSAAIRLLPGPADVVDDIRLAFGGVGPMVLRLTKTEAALRGGPMTLERFQVAADIARDEVTPITDVRGSERYRRILAGNILLKFWHEALAGRPDIGSDGNGNGYPDIPHPQAGVQRRSNAASDPVT